MTNSSNQNTTILDTNLPCHVFIQIWLLIMENFSLLVQKHVKAIDVQKHVKVIGVQKHGKLAMST